MNKPFVAPARIAAYQVLYRVARDQAFVHIVWQETVTRSRLSPQDTGLAQEIVYGVLTWQRLLDHWIQSLSKTPLARIQLEVMVVLRMALYQLRFLERVPAYAVVHDAVDLAKQTGRGAAAFVNGVLRASGRQQDYLKPLQQGDCANVGKREWGLRLSFPDWMVDYFVESFGDKACPLLFSLNQKPVRAVRVNTARSSRQEVLRLLEEEGVVSEPSPISPYGIRLAPGTHPERLQVYKKGLISLQGESSMLVAPLFGNLKGKRFLDACAAPGGKGLHVAELAAGEADVTMVELYEQRAQVIADQAERLQLSEVQVKTMDARKVNDNFAAILLDAPCSGLGTLARKPDLKWRLTRADLEELAALQAELLEALAKRVEPGGTLIYSTCTLSFGENEGQITAFLERHPEFLLQPLHELDSVAQGASEYNQKTGLTYILPQDFHGDGFFLARMQRRNKS